MTPDIRVHKNVVRLSVNSSIRDGGNKCQVTWGDDLCVLSPGWIFSTDGRMDPAGFEPAGLSLRSGFRLQAPASLTPAKRLNFDRELCYRCTTGPVGSFASRGDRCKDASHNSFGRFQIGTSWIARR